MRIRFDENTQPFGPSAILKRMELEGGKVNRTLEKAYSDTDMTASNAMVELYSKGIEVSRIQKMISAGTIGVGKRGEQYKETAYRELNEETGLEMKSIRQLRKPIKVWMFDAKKNKKWQNYLFFFSSSTDKIKLNMENSGYRWASLNDLKK